MTHYSGSPVSRPEVVKVHGKVLCAQKYFTSFLVLAGLTDGGESEKLKKEGDCG